MATESVQFINPCSVGPHRGGCRNPSGTTVSLNGRRVWGKGMGLLSGECPALSHGALRPRSEGLWSCAMLRRTSPCPVVRRGQPEIRPVSTCDTKPRSCREGCPRASKRCSRLCLEGLSKTLWRGDSSVTGAHLVHGRRFKSTDSGDKHAAGAYHTPATVLTYPLSLYAC